MAQIKDTAEYSGIDQMIISASRQIKDTDAVYVGVGFPLEASILAKNLQAPNCTVILENGIVRASLFRLPWTTDTMESQLFAEQLTGLFYVNSLAQAGHLALGVMGAGNIDRYGNVNDTAVGDYNKPIHRWMGSGGANDVMSFCRKTIIIMEQNKRRFPEKVDFVTCPGYFDGEPEAREKVGLPPNTGPVAVITDLATYTFEDGEMTLESVHAGCGITLEKVKAALGWDIKVAKDLMDTEPPTEEEMRTYREKIVAARRVMPPRPMPSIPTPSR
ncbi:MAG: CoA-transferase [Dehalococcoidales bacterium]